MTDHKELRSGGVPVHEILRTDLAPLVDDVLRRLVADIPLYAQLPDEELQGDIRRITERTLRAGGGVTLITQDERVVVQPRETDPQAARFRLFDALARVRAFVHQHRHELSLSEAHRLTLLPSDDLRKLLTP